VRTGWSRIRSVLFARGGGFARYLRSYVSRFEESMSPVSLILNLLWIVFGGIWMAAGGCSRP
jgi:hypothetical protein